MCVIFLQLPRLKGHSRLVFVILCCYYGHMKNRQIVWYTQQRSDHFYIGNSKEISSQN